MSEFDTEVLDQLVTGILAGDPACLALYMERVYPKPTPREAAIARFVANARGLKPADAHEVLAEVMRQVSAGELAGLDGLKVVKALC